jgi:hypothetical protein
MNRISAISLQNSTVIIHLNYFYNCMLAVYIFKKELKGALHSQKTMPLIPNTQKIIIANQMNLYNCWNNFI